MTPCLRDDGVGDAKGTVGLGRGGAHIVKKKDCPPQEC